MKIISMIIIIIRLNFIFIKHPISIGSILLIQTIISSLICRLILNSYLISYILFLIFIGGILILFIYISRIASNEKFYFSIKLIINNIIILIIIIMIIKNFEFSIFMFNNQLNIINDHREYMLCKLFIFPSGNITFLIIFYLLFSIIVVVNIVITKIAPLRRR